MKRLSRSKDRKKSAIERKLEKDLWHFVEDNKTEAWTLLDKRDNYILQKTIRMQMEVWTLLDRGRWLYALLHEARVRRELILWSIEYDEVYISMVATMKESTCSVQPQKKTSSEALKHSWLSIQIRDPMMKERSGIFRAWNL